MMAAVANVRLPTEKAHGNQIMSMCAAFAAAGEQVTLIAPNRWKNPLAGDPFAFYGLPRSFAVRQVRVFDLLPYERMLGAVAFWTERCTFALAALAAASGADRAWTRDELFGALWSLFRRRHPLTLEVHVPQRNFARLYRFVIRRGASIVAITRGVADDLIALGVPAARITVLPDGVDLARFFPQDRTAARRRLGLDPDRRYVVYAGHLYAWKGVETLAAASALVPVGVDTLMVGGSDVDVAAFRARHAAALARVRLVGWRPPAEIPLWLAAADVVVVPTSGAEPIGARYTSPLKLFEAMAAARPIVASDLPSLREVLRDSGNALLVAPDDPQALADGVRRVLADPTLVAALAAAAARDARSYTWDARARAIRDLLGRLDTHGERG